MEKVIIKKAQSSYYISLGSILQACFMVPFKALNKKSMWIIMDYIFNYIKAVYLNFKLAFVNNKSFSSFNPHIVFEALFWKQLYNINDRKTAILVLRNLYMQY